MLSFTLYLLLSVNNNSTLLLSIICFDGKKIYKFDGEYIMAGGEACLGASHHFLRKFCLSYMGLPTMGHK